RRLFSAQEGKKGEHIGNPGQAGGDSAPPVGIPFRLPPEPFLFRQNFLPLPLLAGEERGKPLPGRPPHRRPRAKFPEDIRPQQVLFRLLVKEHQPTPHRSRPGSHPSPARDGMRGRSASSSPGDRRHPLPGGRDLPRRRPGGDVPGNGPLRPPAERRSAMEGRKRRGWGRKGPGERNTRTGRATSTSGRSRRRERPVRSTAGSPPPPTASPGRPGGTEGERARFLPRRPPSGAPRAKPFLPPFPAADRRRPEEIGRAS